jgi:hypothetical protein
VEVVISKASSSSSAHRYVCLWQRSSCKRSAKLHLAPVRPNPAYACRSMLVTCAWPHPSWLLRTWVVMVGPVTDELSAERGNLMTGFTESCCTNRHYWLGTWTSRMQTSAYFWIPNMKDFSFRSGVLVGNSHQVGRKRARVETRPPPFKPVLQ